MFRPVTETNFLPAASRQLLEMGDGHFESHDPSVFFGIHFLDLLSQGLDFPFLCGDVGDGFLHLGPLVGGNGIEDLFPDVDIGLYVVDSLQQILNGRFRHGGSWSIVGI
jgi:hypothetical protein